MFPASHIFLGIMFYCEFLVSVFTGYLLGYLRFNFDSLTQECLVLSCTSSPVIVLIQFSCVISLLFPIPDYLRA